MFMNGFTLPMQFISGLEGTGKSSTIRELLTTAGDEKRCSIIQTVRTVNVIDPLSFPKHRIEIIRNSSCVCCEVFIFFYASLIVLLKESDLDGIIVELGSEADIDQLKNILAATPLKNQLYWGRTLITFDVRDRRFRPYTLCFVRQERTDSCQTPCDQGAEPVAQKGWCKILHVNSPDKGLTSYGLDLKDWSKPAGVPPEVHRMNCCYRLLLLGDRGTAWLYQL